MEEFNRDAETDETSASEAAWQLINDIIDQFNEDHEDGSEAVAAEHGPDGQVGVEMYDATASDIADIAYSFGPGMCMIEDAFAAVAPHPAKVIINDPATVIIDERGGKRVAKCGHGDTFDPKMGIIVATAKFFGINYDMIDRYEMTFRMLSGMSARDLAKVGAIMHMASEAMRAAGIE